MFYQINRLHFKLEFTNFKNFGISKTSSDWADFGSFVGGISGTLLTFFASIFSLISIYFTVKTSEQIQKNEFNFNNGQTQRNLEILYMQNKPYPYLHLETYIDSTVITLQNMGLGPLIINHWELLYLDEGKRFSNFKILLKSVFDNQIQQFEIGTNSAYNHVLSPNSNKELSYCTKLRAN